MSHPNHPPGLPEISDEAGDTPSWVPRLGIVLFVLAVLYIWWSHREHIAPDAGTPVIAE